MPIGAFVTLTAKPGAGDELFALTTDIVADVRTEPGCLLSVTIRDPKTPDSVYMFEIFRDEAAIAEHNVAKHSLEKGPAIQALFGAPPTSRRFETLDWPETLKASY